MTQLVLLVVSVLTSFLMPAAKMEEKCEQQGRLACASSQGGYA